MRLSGEVPPAFPRDTGCGGGGGGQAKRPDAAVGAVPLQRPQPQRALLLPPGASGRSGYCWYCGDYYTGDKSKLPPLKRATHIMLNP